jgi:hypothetical protein
MKAIARAALLVSAGLGLPASPAAGQGKAPLRPPKLYAVLIIDSDSSLRDDVLQDRNQLRRVLRQTFATRPHRLELAVLEGRAVTPAGILGHLQKLRGKVRDIDTVFCHYSGHGTTRDGKHVLTLTSGDLPRARLRSALTALKVRQVVLTSDACSNDATQAEGRAMKRLPDADWEVLEMLFFHHRGVTDINGCQNGAFCWNYAGPGKKPLGGVFTLSLARLMCGKVEDFTRGRSAAHFVSSAASSRGASSRFVTWGEFVQPLKQRTNALFREISRTEPNPRHAIRQQGHQTPQVFSLGTRAPQQITDRKWLFGAEVGRPKDGGAVVEQVYSGTPAARAGFRKGDVVVALNGRKVASGAGFLRLVEQSNGQLRIDLTRAGQRRVASVTCKPVWGNKGTAYQKKPGAYPKTQYTRPSTGGGYYPPTVLPPSVVCPPACPGH